MSVPQIAPGDFCQKKVAPKYQKTSFQKTSSVSEIHASPSMGEVDNAPSLGGACGKIGILII